MTQHHRKMMFRIGGAVVIIGVLASAVIAAFTIAAAFITVVLEVN
jgi:hypothetical protein